MDKYVRHGKTDFDVAEMARLGKEKFFKVNSHLSEDFRALAWEKISKAAGIKEEKKKGK